MKTQNTTLQKLVKGSMLGYLVVLLAVFTVSCNSKSSSNNTSRYGYNNPYGVPGFNGNGGTSGGSNAAAGGEQNGNALLLLSYQTNTSNGVSGGQAIVQGQLRVFNGISCNYNPSFGLNSGVYSMVPYQGQVSGVMGNMLTNIVLAAQGPNTQAIISIPYVSLFTTNVCGYNGLSASVTVMQVNGVSCGTSLYFTDQLNQNVCR